MDWLWTIGTILFVILVFGGGYWLLHRGHLLTRAEHTDPETAKALREVQRQIDQGRSGDGRRR